MRIIIQSKTLEVTKALQRFIELQAQKLVRTGRKIEKVTVILESVARKKNDSKFAKVKFHISIPGKNITVHRYAQDMYAAINETADRAMRYLRKAKEKRLQKMRSRPKIEWQISDPNQERPNVLART